jgi:hypothetical protein
MPVSRATISTSPCSCGGISSGGDVEPLAQVFLQGGGDQAACRFNFIRPHHGGELSACLQSGLLV